MDPAFWGGAPNEAVRLASTRQMLTKYVAMEYYHVPPSFDPTSAMRSPLTPNGGSDELYESDLHPEESANGRRGNPSPCLFFSYSYETHKVTLDEPVLSDCEYPHPAHAGEETFDTNLGWGHLTQRSLDLELESTPKISFKRGYNSAYPQPLNRGMGWGVNHSFNAWLGSDGLAALTYLSVIREDGEQEVFNRLDSGRGFNSNAIYETRNYPIYGARLTWQAGHYKLEYRDGSFATFLQCDDPRVHCYWAGYQDARGNSLHFDRSANQDLDQVSSSDSQGIRFSYDESHRVVGVEASDGKRVSYEYDAAGCLARVERSDGQVALYDYDNGHRMTSFSVVRQPGAAPETVMSNQYDVQGRLVRQELAGVGAFNIEYLATGERNYARELRITDPAGQVLSVNIGDEYVVRAANVRFPEARR
jgi:YD repeat-containing protein